MHDESAYAIYGAYTSLVYLMPIFGGIIADRIFGFKNAVVLGALLMVCGHFLLGVGGDGSLFIAMAFIICGYGYFKSNMSCLLSNLYKEHEGSRQAGFVLLYLGGNVGGILAPIATGYAAYLYGYHAGFSLAGVGMLLGSIIFFIGRKAVPNDEVKYQLIKKDSLRWLFIIFATAGIIFLAYLMLHFLMVGYLLIIAVVFSIAYLSILWVKVDRKHKKSFAVILLFMLFGIVFWMFDQQMGSSIMLFIDRNVQTNMWGMNVPAPVFTSLNSIAILLGGGIIAWMWSGRKKTKAEFVQMFKFFLGLVILTLSFILFFIGAKIATIEGQSSPIWIISGLLALGFAEIFIDPVALAQITKLGGKNAGFLSAVYFLFTGSVANFLAAKLADLSSANFTGITVYQQADLFKNLFFNISLAAIIMVILWLLITLFVRFKEQKRKPVINY